MTKEKQEGLKKLKGHEDGKSSSENSQGKTTPKLNQCAVKSNDKKKDTKDGKKKNTKDSKKGKEKNKKQNTKVSRLLA